MNKKIIFYLLLILVLKKVYTVKNVKKFASNEILSVSFKVCWIFTLIFCDWYNYNGFSTLHITVFDKNTKVEQRFSTLHIPVFHKNTKVEQRRVRLVLGWVIIQSKARVISKESKGGLIPI